MSDDNDDVKMPGPLRRNAPLLLGVLVAMAIGPLASQALESYRGVVLQQNNDQTLVGFDGKPPRWVDTVAAEPGQILQKDRFVWEPVVVPPDPTDHPLVTLHARFTQTYEGVVVHINEPRAAGGPYVAIVQVAEGNKLNVPLYGMHLSNLQVGNRVRKISGEWEPTIIDEGVDNQVIPAPAPSGPAPLPPGSAETPPSGTAAP